MFVSVGCDYFVPCAHTSTWLDVDECAKDNGGCHKDRKCTNTAGGRTCGEYTSRSQHDYASGCIGLPCVLDDAIVVQRTI